MKRLFFFPIILMALSTVAIRAQQANQYQLSSHVLDVSQGAPAAGIVISLYRYDVESLSWEFVDKDLSDERGRVERFLPFGQDNFGAYKLRFETEPYFAEQGLQSIYPYIEVCFYVKETNHYHIPITVSANGYATYRGN